MTHFERLEQAQNGILADIQEKVEKTATKRLPIYVFDVKRYFILLNGKLRVETSSGFYKPEQLYSWEQLAHIADSL